MPTSAFGEDAPVRIRCGDLDQLRDDVRRGLHDRVDHARELRIGADRRAEEEPEAGAAVGDEAEVGEEAAFHAVAAPLDVPGRGRERSEQLLAGIGEQFDVQRPLARKMLVEHRFGDAGGLRDVVHRGRVEAALREHVTRDIEQLLATLVGGKAHQRPSLRRCGRSTDHTLDLSGMT